MVINGEWDQRSLTISIKANCLTISLSVSGGAEVYSFDGEGRLWTALLDGVSYRRGLDGKLVAKWQTPGGGRDRCWLPPEKADELQAYIRKQVAGLLRALQDGQVRLDQPLPQQGLDDMRRAVAFDQQRIEADVARYHQVYKPVGILPPDQYMAVVLQATEGCAFNTCTFCDFYKSRPFRIKKPDEFSEHLLAVREFLGRGLSLRRTIFLGDANALVTPMNRLVPMFEAVHRVYDVQGLGGIYAFLDGFSGEKKSARDYHMLSEMGLERVYVGLESGNQELLNFLKKPGKAADAVKAVRAMKAGGVAVGVIVLLGAGGHTYSRAHVRDTIAAINAMELDLNDIVYFSELVETEGKAYVRDAYQASLRPLTEAERIAQAEAIEEGLQFSRRGGVPHISRYDIRDFVY